MCRRITIALLLLFLAAVEPAISCSSVVLDADIEDPVAAAFARATFVFVGEVENVETVTEWHTMADGRSVSIDVQTTRIKVLQAWKGSKKADDTVTYRRERYCTCCWSAQPGEQWIVYAAGVESTLAILPRSAKAGFDSADIPLIERVLRGEPTREFSIEVPEPHLALAADEPQRAQP
jgi:hypothetical protein